MRDVLQKAIDFAVAKETEAEAFYKEWAGKVTSPATRALLAELAAAESGHKEMLSRIRPEDIIAKGMDESIAPGLVDVLVDVKARKTMDVQEAMILAMKREAASVALYERMAEFGGEAKALFLGLAKEEERHRDRLEAEYDVHITPEN